MSRSVTWLLILSLIILFPMACQQEAEVPPAPLVVEEDELPPVEVPQINQALVTFLAGEVLIAAGGDWEYLDIGDFLETDDVIRVEEASYCEIQFGDIGALRVEANTELALSDVSIQKDSSSIGVKLAVGSVLAKVNTLSGNDKFSVSTPSAVCGVRGTQFGVQVSTEGQTKLAVSEGKVAVLPGNVDIESLKNSAEDLEEQTVIQAVAKIEASAPIVAEQQELIIGAQTLQQTEAAIKAVEKKVGEIAVAEQKGEQVSTKDLQDLTELLVQTETAIEQAMEKPEQISEQSIAELKPIEKMKLFRIPVPPAAAAKAGEKPAEIQLEKFSFDISPRDAEILINGEVVGAGRFSGLFAHGDTLNILLRRGGYLDHSLEIMVERAASKLFKIQLEEKPTPKAEITLTVSPADAVVQLDGKSLGRGNQIGRYELGQTLEFTVSHKNHITQTLDVTVAEKAVFAVALDPKLKRVVVQTQPREAEIFLQGRKVGTGIYEADHALDEILDFSVRREGYVEDTLKVDVAAALSGPLQVVLTPKEVAEVSVVENNAPTEETTTAKIAVEAGTTETKPAVTAVAKIPAAADAAKPVPTKRIEIRTVPPDAEIILNGKVVTRGNLSEVYPLDETMSFQIRKEGYTTQILTIEMDTAKTSPYLVQLKGIVFPNRITIASNPLTGNILIDNNRIFAADTRGNLIAANRRGEVLWNIQTQNYDNENSSPVLFDRRIYFSGSDEFVIANATNGNVISRLKLDKDYSHLFGRRVVAYKQNALFPANKTIRIINAFTGETIKDIPVPGGTRMTPTVYGEKLLIVNQQGFFLIIDPRTAAVEAEIKTGAIQPIALAITVYDDKGYFADRRGRIVCVDLSSRKVLWDNSLPGAKSRGIFWDLDVGRHGVFAYSEETVYGYDLNNGQPLFKPIESVSSPPLYNEQEGNLYFGTFNKTLMTAGVDGYIKKALGIKAVITTRPHYRNGNIIVGTDTGEIIEINPKFIR